jgi:excisionase family DNA binding protein
MESRPEPKEDLLTVEDVASRLGVHEQTVRRWLRDGQLKGVMLTRRAGYRIRESELEYVIDEGLRPSKELALV